MIWTFQEKQPLHKISLFLKMRKHKAFLGFIFICLL